MEQRPAKTKNPIPPSILIAEDHPATRRLLESLLIKAGYSVTTASNGREALDRFRLDFYPMVLMDWIMPEMDGLELCEALRKHSNQKYVYILFLTGKDLKDDVVKALQAGADDYVTKPFDRSELLARIRTGQRILDLERSLKEAYEEIKMLSVIDPLTGVYNRGYLNDHLSEEIVRSLRYRHPLHIILCDLDHFKSVNDRYGHQAGDEVLKSFADLMKDSIRQNVDWVARYGGEEFVVVLPETDASGARAVAERLRRAVSKKRCRAQGRVVRITVSCGVSGLGPDRFSGNVTADFLLNEADKCLLRAKQEGRNRVTTSWMEKNETTIRRKCGYG